MPFRKYYQGILGFYNLPHLLQRNSEIAMIIALHDGFRSGQLHPWIESPDHVKITATGQEIPQFTHAQLSIQLRVPASNNMIMIFCFGKGQDLDTQGISFCHQGLTFRKISQAIAACLRCPQCPSLQGQMFYGLPNDRKSLIRSLFLNERPDQRPCDLGLDFPSR